VLLAIAGALVFADPRLENWLPKGHARLPVGLVLAAAAIVAAGGGRTLLPGTQVLRLVAVALGAITIVYIRLVTWEDTTKRADFAREIALLALILSLVVMFRAIGLPPERVGGLRVAIPQFVTGIFSWAVWLYCTRSDERARIRRKVSLSTAALTGSVFFILSIAA